MEQQKLPLWEREVADILNPDFKKHDYLLDSTSYKSSVIDKAMRMEIDREKFKDSFDMKLALYSFGIGAVGGVYLGASSLNLDGFPQLTKVALKTAFGFMGGIYGGAFLTGFSLASITLLEKSSLVKRRFLRKSFNLR